MPNSTATPLICPSAPPEAEGAVVIGISGGTVDSPKVTYLRTPAPVDDSTWIAAAPSHPSEIFRIAAPCAESACVHFTGTRCELIRSIVTTRQSPPSKPPACGVRSTCRWWQEHGPAACRRCPGVVTCGTAN